MRKGTWQWSIMFLLIILSAPNIWAAPEGASLRVAFKNDTPFYQFIDGSGVASGLHVDLMNAIARENELAVEYLPMDKLWDCIQALSNGEVDAVIGVPSSESGQYMSSMETMTANIGILARQSFLPDWDKELFSRFTAVLEYNTTNISLMSNMGASTYIVTGSQIELLNTHMAGQGDFMICDLNCIKYLLRQAGVQNEFTVVQSNIGTVGYVTVVRKGNLPLLRLINDGLMRLRLSGEYDRIRERWIEKDSDSREQITQIVRLSFTIAAIAGLGITIFAFMSARIKNLLIEEVREKTLELNHRIVQLQSESELRNRIIERSPNGMVLFDRQNRVTLINSSACRLVGIADPPLGSNVLDLGLFGEILKLHTDKGFAGECQVSNRTFALPYANGFRRVYQYSILPILEADQCSNALITVEDITVDEEKKQAIIERSKNKTLNLMMAGIAHEIKNPLTGIRNFAKLIKTKREDKQFLDYFSILVPQEVDRISRLIESMMQYARPPKGNPDKMDLSFVANECAYMAKATIKNTKIMVATDLSDGHLIEADRDQINQVLINIMMNSIASMEKKLSYKPELGPLTLRISTLAQGENIVIIIRDDGEGMSPHTLQYCTEPFYTSKSTGTGLGLALSKQLVQENNGSLIIQSQETVGTEIAIQFRRCLS